MKPLLRCQAIIFVQYLRIRTAIFGLEHMKGINKLLRDNETGNITFRSYTKKDGLPNNMIESIAEDNNGNLWIGTNGGLFKTDLAWENFSVFYESDGLQSNEFSENAVFKRMMES
jgi:ligand-binding sensor domain-containing protein